MAKLTTEEFIEKARKVHGDKYNYSNVEYEHSKKNVCIICPTHGEFWMRPNNHLNGQGCPNCCSTKKINIEDFLERVKKVHGDKYDFSKIEYTNNATKVCVICHKKDKNGNEHGEFWITPGHLLNGVGCKKCFDEKKKVLYTKPIEKFIEEARVKHDNKYDYSKVEYINNGTKIEIVCPIHGSFWQTPHNHLSGNGCPKCHFEKMHNERTKGFEKFVSEANYVHLNKFIYKEPYINKDIPIEIICPIHGSFWQTPKSHLNGNGCPKCNSSKLEKQVERILLNNDIKYIYQCGKSTLEWIKPQRFDFYIPKYNVAIECQGGQHFIPSNFGGKDKDPNLCLKIIKERDERKKKLCEKHNVKLLYFSDKQWNENMITDENKLLEKIFE